MSEIKRLSVKKFPAGWKRVYLICLYGGEPRDGSTIDKILLISVRGTFPYIADDKLLEKGCYSLSGMYDLFFLILSHIITTFFWKLIDKKKTGERASYE